MYRIQYIPSGKKTTTPNFPLGPNDKDDVIKINARPHGDLTSLGPGHGIIVQHILLRMIKKKKKKKKIRSFFTGVNFRNRRRPLKLFVLLSFFLFFFLFLLFNFLIGYKNGGRYCDGKFLYTCTVYSVHRHYALPEPTYF